MFSGGRGRVHWEQMGWSMIENTILILLSIWIQILWSVFYGSIFCIFAFFFLFWEVSQGIKETDQGIKETDPGIIFCGGSGWHLLWKCEILYLDDKSDLIVLHPWHDFLWNIKMKS